ncbi:hypothetical protein ACLOJK_037723 [Asimina triloba]
MNSPDFGKTHHSHNPLKIAGLARDKTTKQESEKRKGKQEKTNRKLDYITIIIVTGWRKSLSAMELSSTRASIHQGIDSSKQRITFIEKRGPELEAEKKVAAAARNFKEAGRIAAEAKSLSTEKEDIQNKVEQDIFRLNELEEQMKETVKRLQENEGLISSKEKEAAMARYERLQLVSAAAMAERSAALKLGDLEEANILLAGAESTKIEASRLQQSYEFEAVEIEERDLISMQLIVNLSGKDLAEMTASLQPSAV